MTPAVPPQPFGHRPPGHQQRQRGATLLVAVVFLLLLSMLGVWSMSNNVLQERMAGNLRNRETALQAAEAAARYVETTLATWKQEAFDGTAAGLRTFNPAAANDRAYWMTAANWTGARSVPTGNLTQVAEQPQYLIDKMPNTKNPASGLFDVENYRITIRAVGRDSNAVVVIQSILQYTP